MKNTSFKNIIAQKQACDILVSALDQKRVPHAYLFAGPAGVGKKTTALQWAKILNCQAPVSSVWACESCSNCQKISSLTHPDVLWINYAYQAHLLKEPVEKQKSIKINTLREMERQLRLKPMEGRVKIAFVEPAEHLVEAAAHSLLKILEEPPPNTHLVLVAADASQLLDTIRSRCQWVRFRPLPIKELTDHLVNRGDGTTEEEAHAAALQSQGSMSQAMALLTKTEELTFDWENAPLSELVEWCDQYRNPRLGRNAAKDFLRRLLGKFQSELYAGQKSPQDVSRVLDALHQLKQNVTPALILQVLLLKFRREKKKEKNRN